MKPPMFMLLTYTLATGVLLLQANGKQEEQQPDIITTKNNDYYGFMNQFDGFTCEASGTNLQFFWRHRDQLVDANYPLKFPRLNTSNLQPTKGFLTEAYDGTYQCFARNSIGTVFGRKATVKFTIVGDFVLAPTVKTIEKVTVGQPVGIHCPSHKKSYNVKYKWEYQQALERVTLPPSRRYFVSENGTLYFSFLESKDVTYINSLSGIHCKQQAIVDGQEMALNSHQITLSEDTKTITVRKSKPVIKTVIGTQSVLFGEKLAVFKCGAVGNPIPDLKWYKIAGNVGERTEIKNGAGYKLDRFNQLLSIFDVTTNKAGDYVCVANNTEGKDEAFGRIIVADRPQWTVGGALTDVNPAIDSKFVWECQALGGATYNWYKNGFEMSRSSSQNDKYVIINANAKSQLIFAKVSVDNDGMYQCTAGNEKETIYSTGRLKVKIKKPEFLEAMGPLTLIRTTKGVVVCPVDAAPLPDVVWKKDSQRITYDKRIKLADNKRDLLISNVSDSDQGLYTCDASNNLGSAQDSSYVTVGVDITIVEAPVSNRNVTERFRFELACEASGDPSYEVKYRWLFNGLPLQYNARIHWIKEKYRLLILDALVSDTGTYTCVAFAETPLYIEKPMDVDIVVRAPANPPDIVYLSGDCYKKDATLNWKVGALNNEEVYFYVIEWSTSYDPSRWEALPRVTLESATSKKLDFRLLPPYSQISFRVIIANRIGNSKPSLPTEASDCITPPSAPPRSPLLIYGVAKGPNTLKLIWTPVHQTYWGSAGFNYTVQYRRKTKDNAESRWLFGKAAHERIYDGNNDSIVIPNPGYYNEWEFRIRSNNHYGSSETWTTNTSFSGQDSPEGKPTGLEPDRISSRSVDISWQRVSAPRNGSIDGYRIEYWRSLIGADVSYTKLRKRKKRDDEEEEEELDLCFNPAEPCVHFSPEKESKLGDLQPYKLYHIRIAAYNSGGSGPLSAELTVETEEDTPGEPYAVDVYSYGQYAKLTWKEPRHMNGKILNYEVFGKGVVTTLLPWWMRRHIIYDLDFNSTYEAKLRARTSTGWGEPVFRWFATTHKQKPAKPLVPEVVGYGADGVNVTFMEPLPIIITKYAGPIDEDPWEQVPVDGFDMEHKGTGGYPERFRVLYRKVGEAKFRKTESKQMYSERDQTWIIIENLEKFALYEFATLPNNKQGDGPMSDLAIALPGGIVPQVEKLHWYQRDWFIALSVIFVAASILFLVIVFATYQLKDIYYEGAPKRRKDRERERIYEPEDVDGGFNEFTLKSARSSRSVVTSRSEPPPPYSVTNGSASRHSGDFEDEDLDSDGDDDKHEVSTYYSDDKKIPLDDLDEEDEEEDSRLATFV